MAASIPALGNPLQDKDNFPPFSYIPSENEIDENFYCTDDGCNYSHKHHWCFIGEITDDTHAQLMNLRNRILVKDVKGESDIPIAFYPDPANSREFFDFSELKKGYTICIRYAEKHFFWDMTCGFRVECLPYVKIIKCTLETLCMISTLDPTNRPKLCWTCGAQQSKYGLKLLSCQRCKLAKYCGRDCQKSDWKYHKKLCEYIPDYSILVSLADRVFTKYIPFEDY